LTDFSNFLLSSLVVYGLPLIFGIVLVSSVGVPLPATLVVLTAGALVQQELLSLSWVVIGCLIAAVLGDHLGYGIGRWGGRPLIGRLAHLIGGQTGMQRAVGATQRWGWWTVFFSRWLLTPLGAPCNWTCGMTDYPLYGFFLAVVLGETIYVAMLVYVGFVFGDQLEYVSALITSIGPWLMGVVLLTSAAWWLLKSMRKPAKTPSVLMPVVDALPVSFPSK
jgi:membrane protein DedA with SNARE-associated domain